MTIETRNEILPEFYKMQGTLFAIRQKLMEDRQLVLFVKTESALAIVNEVVSELSGKDDRAPELFLGWDQRSIGR